MRTMWCVLWCVAATVIAGAVGAPVEDNISLAPISRYSSHFERTPPDDDGGSYADTGAVHYDRGTDAVSPWLYLLAEMPHESQISELLSSGERRSREKRKMPSLSINNPMEVLRQRLMLEVARKQMREANQRQAFANRMFLQNVGKRGYWRNVIPSRPEN